MKISVKWGALLGLATLAASAFASVWNSTYTTYYAEPAKITMVGESILTCGGNTYKEGVVTKYYTIRTTMCYPR